MKGRNKIREGRGFNPLSWERIYTFLLLALDFFKNIVTTKTFIMISKPNPKNDFFIASRFENFNNLTLEIGLIGLLLF